MEHAVVGDGVAKNGAGKDIRRMVRLQRYPGETNSRSETIGNPGMPTRVGIAVRKNRRDGYFALTPLSAKLTLRILASIVSDTLLIARTPLWPPMYCESTGSIPT